MTTNFSLTYKGVNYVADNNGSYADANSLGQLTPDGINAVALTLDFGIDAVDNTVYSSNVFTDTNTDLATTISEAEAAGQNVMVRPLIDFLPSDANFDPNSLNGDYYNTEFRAEYNPGAAGSAGANSFFASYQAMIVQEAKVAQQGGAAIFDIGVELDQITGPSYLSYWTSIINAIRAPVADGGAGFTGKLTYSALWDDQASPWQYQNSTLPLSIGDLSKQVSFWSQLDYVGIDEYAALTDNPDPTVQDLVNAWTLPYNTVPDADSGTEAVVGKDSLIQYYENLSTETGKPLLFTELGYANSSDAASQPANPGVDLDTGGYNGAVTDPTLQADLYTAFFQAWQEDGNSSLNGVYLWEWEPAGQSSTTEAGQNVEDYNVYPVQGLPAETAVKNGFDSTLCYLRGTLIATPEGERPIESLAIGDAVMTRFGGVQTIKWIGRQSFNPRFVAKNRERRPVCISAGALGDGLPRRDLFISGGHSVLLANRLVLANDLLNGITITEHTTSRQMDYFNIELENHDCVLAEGAWSETYADGPGLRASFHNEAEFWALYPDYQTPETIQLCAPRPLAGPELETALARPAARAAAAITPGPLDGSIDKLSPSRIEGWAIDTHHPHLPIRLDVYLGEECLATWLACDPRGDLAMAGKGNGHHAFALDIVPPLTPDELQTLRIARRADGAVIPNHAAMPVMSAYLFK